MGKIITDYSSVTTVGLDLAKHVFFVHAVDDAGRVVAAKALRRKDLVGFFAGCHAVLWEWKLAARRIIGRGKSASWVMRCG